MTKRGIRIIQRILIVLLILIAAGTVGYELMKMIMLDKLEQLQDMKVMTEVVTIRADSADSNANNELDSNEYEDVKLEIVPDFQKICEENSDVFAWLEIPGTEIDYPVLHKQGRDGFYLNHNFDGSYGYPGCLYTEDVTGEQFDVPVSIIYGHNMSDGSMFYSLHDFSDESFFGDNRYFNLYSPMIDGKVESRKYLIVAAGTYTDDYIPDVIDVNKSTDVQQLLATIAEHRDYVCDKEEIANITDASEIVILSTCNKNRSSTRYLVIGKREER